MTLRIYIIFFLQLMAEGFRTIETRDPPKLQTFIEGVSTSVMGILSVSLSFALSITSSLFYGHFRA